MSDIAIKVENLKKISPWNDWRWYIISGFAELVGQKTGERGS